MSDPSKPSRGRVVIMRGHELEKIQQEMCKLVEEGYVAHAPVVMADFHGKMTHLVVVMEWSPPTEDTRESFMQEALALMQQSKNTIIASDKRMEELAAQSTNLDELRGFINQLSQQVQKYRAKFGELP